MAEVGHQIRLQVRQSILQAGFAGSLLTGHSMGGALACLLAADPVLAARSLVRIGQWIRRARTEGRTATQAAWVGDQPNRTDHEAAAPLGGYVQWPIDEAVMQLTCPVLAFATDPGRLPVGALRQARPDVTLKIVPACGQFVHVFAGELAASSCADTGPLRAGGTPQRVCCGSRSTGPAHAPGKIALHLDLNREAEDGAHHHQQSQGQHAGDREIERDAAHQVGSDQHLQARQQCLTQGAPGHEIRCLAPGQTAHIESPPLGDQGAADDHRDT